jgi:hypothetical protein
MRLFIFGLYALLLWIAATLFQYCLWCLTAKDAPWYLDVVGGLVTSPFIIPVAIVFAIMQAVGIPVPFIH